LQVLNIPSCSAASVLTLMIALLGSGLRTLRRTERHEDRDGLTLYAAALRRQGVHLHRGLLGGSAEIFLAHDVVWLRVALCISSLCNYCRTAAENGQIAVDGQIRRCRP
jgi:hypothetical protein